MTRQTISFVLMGIAAVALAGCAAGGRIMQQVGDGLTDYSKSSDGILGKATGFAGGVYSSVGCSLQGDSANANASKRPCTPAEAASAAAAAASTTK